MVALAGGLISFSPSAAKAQALKLETLQFPPTSVVGPWVSYRVRTQSGSLPAREYTQRVALVSRETYHGQEGFWVELRTEGQPSGKRIERGFFTLVQPFDPTEAVEGEEEGLAPPSPPAAATSVRLARYQVLTSGGKLYEYPAGRAHEARVGGDVSTLELFEYDDAVPPIVENLGPDTLRLGRRLVPVVVERTRRLGQGWPVKGDSTHVNRPLLVQTYWRNPAVPITGFARSRFQVTMERLEVAAGDSVAVPMPPEPDSLVAPGGAPSGGGPPDSLGGTGAGGPRAARRLISWTEVTLVDLGADAIPEVTQKPETEPSPEPSQPGTPR